MHLRHTLLLLVGCVDSIALDDYAPEIWQAQCDWYVRCGALVEEDCASRFFAPGPNSVAAVNAGLASYDDEAAAACVAAYADLPCDVSEPYPDFSACSNVFRGHKAIGERCQSWLECEDGDCFFADGGCDDACCEADEGTCDRERPAQEDAQLGEDCDLLFGRWCARGLYCTMRISSEPGICAPLPKHGEPCDGYCAELGDNCDSTTRRCEDASVRGEPCMDSNDCTESYACGMDNRCGDGWRKLKPDGSSCLLGGYDIHSECQSGWCEAGICMPAPVCY